MLKWAISPRITADFFDEQTGNGIRETFDLLPLETIVEQHQLPCLVRFVNDDIYDSMDNYCLLLCQTTDPYLIVSNETERFAVPLSFDGTTIFLRNYRKEKKRKEKKEMSNDDNLFFHLLR